jgi:hypothetical protein
MSTHKRKDSPSGKSIVDFVLIGLSLFRIIPNVINVVEYDAQEVKHSVVNLAFLYLIAIVISLSTWLSLLAIGIVFLLSLQFTLLQALSVTFAVNIFLLLLVYIFILKTKSRLSFKNTRALISNLFG